MGNRHKAGHLFEGMPRLAFFMWRNRTVFWKNRFSVSLEANDIFNKSYRNVTFYNKDVTLRQNMTSDTRALLLTLQYNFNTSRNRYKGKGAGNEEINRF